MISETLKLENGTRCSAFPQGPDGDVRDHEELRPHLREALVARPLPHRLQDLRQHEAPRAADRGQGVKPRAAAACHAVTRCKRWAVFDGRPCVCACVENGVDDDHV